MEIKNWNENGHHIFNQENTNYNDGFMNNEKGDRFREIRSRDPNNIVLP